jgi:3-phenylpropionate/trans-cinnamate dioxygenase ferredoxin component
MHRKCLAVDKTTFARAQKASPIGDATADHDKVNHFSFQHPKFSWPLMHYHPVTLCAMVQAGQSNLLANARRCKHGLRETRRSRQTAPISQVVEPMGEKSFVAVARVDELPLGARKLIQLGDVSVLLCHTAARIFAVRNQCSHAREPLDCGQIRYGWISCPVHGARFDLASGEALNPPATLPIEVFEVRLTGDMIEVAT